MKNRSDARRITQKKRLCMTLVMLMLVSFMLGGCGSDSAADTRPTAPSDSASTAAPTAPLPTVDEAYLHGEAVSAEMFIGSWVTYSGESEVIYTFDDDGCAIFQYASGGGAEYHWKLEGDRIILTSGEKRKVYIWAPRAVTFIADHQYGEAANVTALVRDQIADFTGFAYVEGDYLYMGRICLCRRETLDSFDDRSLAGSWTGCDGDRVTFTEDGAYHYRCEGYDYDGSYRIDDDGRLILHLDGTDDSVLSDPEWGVSGRVLHLQKHYYFRDAE